MKEELSSILKRASTEEIEGLANLLKCDPNIESIFLNLQSYAGSNIKKLGNSLTYKGIVCKVAGKLKIDYLPDQTSQEIEIKINQKIFETMWNKMSDEEKNEMKAKLEEMAKKYDKSGVMSSSALVGALIAGNLSGFGVYLLASTSLGALTGVLGVTLPFAVYTTISSAISVILGPVGWIGTGLFVIWKLTGPNYKKLIPAIVYISNLRSKQELNL